jgi:hypothetical protein
VNASSSSGGFSGLLFLVFLVLKLTGVVGWSWWWVTAPLWAPAVAALAIVTLVFLCLAAELVMSR